MYLFVEEKELCWRVIRSVAAQVVHGLSETAAGRSCSVAEAVLVLCVFCFIIGSSLIVIHGGIVECVLGIRCSFVPRHSLVVDAVVRCNIVVIVIAFVVVGIAIVVIVIVV